MKAKKKYMAGGAVIGGAIQSGLGLAQAIYGGVQAKRASKELERVRASAPSLETPSEYMRLYKEAFNNDLLNRQLESLKSSAGSSISALGQGGGRALIGGVQGVASGMQEGTQKAVDAQQLMQMGALETLAGAQSRTQQMKEGRYQTELEMAQQFRDAAVQNIGSGIASMGTGAMYAFSEGNPFKKKSSTPETNAKDGAVVKTKGEFSHEKNPIHMVQKGEKVGEMTGGEYIFNPKQMANIKSLVNNSPEKLQKYIKGLIKKFEK